MTIKQTAERASVFSIVSNAALSCVKWIAGYFGNSYALIADAIESTTDVFSSVIVL
ncbi:MAG: cation transporter, partial [Prevotellaceae bacterium]|nr:cation transporter [Prevotellaceae bacterium]